MDLINNFLKLPELLNGEYSLDESFNILKTVFEQDLGFDFVLIGYFNSNSIEIKTMSEVDERVKFISVDIIGNNFKTFIDNKKAIVAKIKQGQHSILNEIGMNVKKDCSIVLVPLMIKEAVFGVILGIKFGKTLIDEETFAATIGYAGVCSYLIKDAELSNVFKLQLKILNENVTEKAITILDIKEQNAKIREAEKIKTEFLMNMSHSLRTPLNAIIGSSEALQMGVFGKLNTKQDEYILDIHNSGKEMLGLVNDILDMSKIEAGAMEVIADVTDISLLIKECVNIVKSLAKNKNIKINSKLPEKKYLIMADEQKINQILYNLLSNAIKFSNENGLIEIGFNKVANKIIIYVKDSGIGIEKQYHDKIFEKFEQIENPYRKKYASTGLGLTITKKLVEMHKGKIWVESKLGAGSTFYVELPVE